MVACLHKPLFIHVAKQYVKRFQLLIRKGHQKLLQSQCIWSNLVVRYWTFPHVNHAGRGSNQSPLWSNHWLSNNKQLLCCPGAIIICKKMSVPVCRGWLQHFCTGMGSSLLSSDELFFHWGTIYTCLLLHPMKEHSDQTPPHHLKEKAWLKLLW